MYIIFAGEFAASSLSVFSQPAREIVGYSGVKCSIVFIGKDVDIVVMVGHGRYIQDNQAEVKTGFGVCCKDYLAICGFP